MGRSILTILVGFVAAMVAVFILQTIATIALFGSDIDPENPPAMTAFGWVLFMLIDLVGAALAGWVAAKMARDEKWRHVYWMIGFMFVIRILYAVTYTGHPYPAFNYVSAFLMIPAIWFGGWLVLRGGVANAVSVAEGAASVSPVEAPITPDEPAEAGAAEGDQPESDDRQV